MIPAATGKPAKAPSKAKPSKVTAKTPTATAAQAAAKNPNTSAAIADLKGMIAGAKGKKVDSKTQNEIAKALVELEKRRKAGKMTPDEETEFAELLKAAGKSNALSKGQKDYVNKTMIPTATGKPAKLTTTKRTRASKTSTAKSARAESRTATKATRMDAVASGKFDKFIADLTKAASFRTKLNTLKKLIAFAQGISAFRDEQQNTYAKVLERLYTESPAGDKGTLKLFEQLVNNSTLTDLLSDKQKDWTAKSLIPRIRKK